MYFYFKRVFDFFLSLIILGSLSPVLVIVSLLLALELKGTPLFRQKRTGFREQEFEVIKFRTMTNDKDQNGNLLPNKDRLTKLGGIIRKTSLDELPQLMNVLKGDMSFIGPRPLPTRYYPYFEKEEKQRFKVRPGISGFAQISGRNNLMWDKRMEKDIQYVRNFGPKQDIRIFWQTVLKVIRKDSVEVDPTATMIDFDEYKKQKWGLK